MCMWRNAIFNAFGTSSYAYGRVIYDDDDEGDSTSTTTSKVVGHDDPGRDAAAVAAAASLERAAIACGIYDHIIYHPI